jgi:hypothetical protein
MDARRSAGEFRHLDGRPATRSRPSRHSGRKRHELREIYARLRKAGGEVIEQGQTACCYAKSEKSWIDDPSGIAWETFFTNGESTDYGDGSGERAPRIAHEKSCCAPQAAQALAGVSES